MDDLISRQAATDALGEEPLVWNEDDAGEVAERNQWKRDVAAIKALPSAERHGHWEFIGGYGYQYRCSVCVTCAERKTKFCSNCGAKMDGDKE